MYYATAQEMERLDKLAVDTGLEIRQMMELAGWHMVPLFKMLQIPTKSKIVIVVGKGNKGGDGLSAARHLLNNGWNVSVILVSKDIKKDARHHLDFLQNILSEVVVYSDHKNKSRHLIQESNILVDALIGYHLNGSPRGIFAEVIKLMNNAQKKIIAYDLPSGIDASNGECLHPCIRADVTLSLALPKLAFKNGNAKSFGKIFVADIGIPAFLYNKIAPKSRPSFSRFAHNFVTTII